MRNKRGTTKRPLRRADMENGGAASPAAVPPLEFSLTIDDFTGQGNGVGHLTATDVFFERDGSTIPLGDHALVRMTVFVPDVLPGDVVHCRLVKRKKSVLEAQVVKLLSPSPERRGASESSFDTIEANGFPLLHWQPECQARWKQQLVRNALIRLGGFSETELPCLSWIADEEFHYRNKVNLRLTSRGLLGDTMRGTHDVAPLSSYIFAAPAIEETIRRWNRLALSSTAWASLFSPVRMVILRANEKEEILAALVTDPITAHQRTAMFDALHPLAFTVLCQSENRRPGDVRLREPIHYATEQTTLDTHLHGLSFSVSPASFFQVNRYLTQVLYDTALSCFTDLAKRTVLDLYCGTGTTSLLMARQAKHVVGVEVVEAAVANARQNASINGISNATFFAAKAEDVIEELTHRYRGSGVSVLVDPPRKGLDPLVCQSILAAAPDEFVYVSCNPATLARDLGILRECGWVLQKGSIVDMFPNTTEVECVMKMTKA